ncbi:hypothetical protein ERO13_A04G065714v2, partial [Gossypium hirsutum]
MVIANKMQIHGERLANITIVEKILWSMLPKFNFVICSIKKLKYLNTLSLDELQYSLMEEVFLLILCQPSKEPRTSLWYLDTGCSNYMCGDKYAFFELDETFHSRVKFGDNSHVAIKGKGQVKIQTMFSSMQIFSDMFSIPNLKINLLSVGQLKEKGYEVSIK